MKKLKEWFIPAPWGKIALVSWGDAAGEPVLLVHGRQDSAATFIPLLEHLPESKHYVAVDLPGHGWSEPMPVGVTLTRLHFLAAVQYAVEHLGWDRFMFIGHSMGCEQGLFYNVIYPGRIRQFILLDPKVSLQRLQIHNYEEYYRNFHEAYYKNYTRYNQDDRVYSKRSALDAVMRSRGLNEEQAEVVLSRNLWPIGEDKYRLSWDRRLKQPAPQNYPGPYYVELFTSSAPPTLVVSASRSPVVSRERERLANALLEAIGAKVAGGAQYQHDVVPGGHDVHLTHPGMVAGRITAFLDRTKAKL